MLVRLIHPDHGAHIAYSNAEVEACKKNGWKEEPKDDSGPSSDGDVKQAPIKKAAKKNSA